MAPLLDPVETATYLNVALETLHYWRGCSPPKGPRFVKVGRQVRYRPADVEAWLEARTVETAA